MLAAALAPAVQAQDTAETKRLTILTFSAPVQLPGMTLPAGKYRFEMADINSAAHVVRVLNEDGTKVLGTFSTIPTTIATRDLRDTDTLVMWAERPAGQPQAAKEWYYPQRSTGEEFVYPEGAGPRHRRGEPRQRRDGRQRKDRSRRGGRNHGRGDDTGRHNGQ